MVDKKIIASVIKTLEKSAGVLDISLSTGELSEATRKQIAEMLNKAVIDILFSGTDESKDEIITEGVITETTEHAAPEEHDENLFVLQTDSETFKPFIELESAPEVTIEETEEEKAEKLRLEEEERIAAEKEERRKEEEAQAARIAAEEEEKINAERKKLEDLKAHLEEERKKLDEEWLAEKNKREQEMDAVKQLLETLAREQDLRNPKQKTEDNSVFEPFPQNDPHHNIQETTYTQPAPEPTPEPVITFKPYNKPEPKKADLSESFENEEIIEGATPIADLTKAVGINDKFQFIKELFGGDSDLYAETVKKLNTIGSLAEAVTYIESNFNWENNDAVKRFIVLVRRRYM